MQQIKIFKGIESEINDMEARINQWLRDGDVRVVQLTGNIAPQSDTVERSALGKNYTPSDVLIVVIYEQAST